MELGPVKGGKPTIAFIEDHNGYKFELIQTGPTSKPLFQVMLLVEDLNRSISLHDKV